MTSLTDEPVRNPVDVVLGQGQRQSHFSICRRTAVCRRSERAALANSATNGLARSTAESYRPRPGCIPAIAGGRRPWSCSRAETTESSAWSSCVTASQVRPSSPKRRSSRPRSATRSSCRVLESLKQTVELRLVEILLLLDRHPEVARRGGQFRGITQIVVGCGRLSVAKLYAGVVSDPDEHCNKAAKFDQDERPQGNRARAGCDRHRL